MTKYLISFDDGAMSFPEEELPATDEAAHGVVRAAKEAGVWVFGGGVQSQRASIVATGPEFVPVLLRQRDHARAQGQTDQAHSSRTSSPRRRLDSDHPYNAGTGASISAGTRVAR